MSLEAESDVASGGNWSEAVIQEAYGVKLSVVLFWLASDVQISDPP